MTTLALNPIADLADVVGTGSVVAFNAGADETLYVVVACHPLDYRQRNAGGASFPKVIPRESQKYRVLRVDASAVTVLASIDAAPFNVHDVQPLEGGILLVGARSHRRGPEDFDLNGHLFDLQGRHQRSFLLGDGIQTVQASAGGTIWAGYFDEGVFGNFGWPDPVGAAGLVAWSAAGEKRYEFAPPPGLDTIADCYALNVASDTVTWCCYYTTFPLVRIRDFEVDGHWNVPISGSSAFAVSGQHVLFSGGYQERDRYALFRFADGPDVQPAGEFRLQLQVPATEHRAVGRGDSIWLLAGSLVYRLSVDHALGS